MASYLQKLAKHYRPIRKLRTEAQKNILNKGTLLGNISIGGDKVRNILRLGNTSEEQNFDLVKYIVLSTRYEYSIQYIVSYNTICYFLQEIYFFIQNSLYCHYKKVQSSKQITTILNHPIVYFCCNNKLYQT
jgi:hypothetical protein